MLKPYHDRGDLHSCQFAAIVALLEHKSVEERVGGQEVKEVIRLKNSDILNILDKKLKHLHGPKKDVIKSILQEFTQIFPDAPGQTTAAIHDVDVVMQGQSSSMHIRLTLSNVNRFARKLNT